jgi:pseudaminic acid synthase
VSSGAEVIEKHIALKNEKDAPDYYFSLKDKEIQKYAQNLRETSAMMGKFFFYRNPSEKKNLKFRQSIYAISEIKKGDFFNKNNIKIIRPANGLNPYFFNKLINKKSPTKINKGTPLKISLLKKMHIKKY